jgi:uncharacterized protein (DUF1499 family)
VFIATQKAVIDLAWELVNANASNGIIEATDTTFWFGFKDDVVIRIAANAEGSVLDIRSKSRVGESDLGKNAERISTLIQQIETALNNK